MTAQNLHPKNYLKKIKNKDISKTHTGEIYWQMTYYTKKNV